MLINVKILKSVVTSFREQSNLKLKKKKKKKQLNEIYVMDTHISMHEYLYAREIEDHLNFIR